MFDELDEDDAKKLKYLAVFGVAVVVMLLVLLLGLDMLGSKKRKSKPTHTQAAAMSVAKPA